MKDGRKGGRPEGRKEEIKEERATMERNCEPMTNVSRVYNERIATWPEQSNAGKESCP